MPWSKHDIRLSSLSSIPGNLMDELMTIPQKHGVVLTHVRAWFIVKMNPIVIIYTVIRCDKIKLVNLAIEVSPYFQKNTNLNPIKSND